MPRTRPPYLPEFRRQMVDLVGAGRDPDDLAREFEPTGQSIRHWTADADKKESQRGRCFRAWTAEGYIVGAVCPARGTGAALVLPCADKGAMTLHLAEISQMVAPGAHAVVVVDGAGWHKPGGALKLPDTISLLVLTPYCPELNPQDNIWQYLR